MPREQSFQCFIKIWRSGDQARVGLAPFRISSDEVTFEQATFIIPPNDDVIFFIITKEPRPRSEPRAHATFAAAA